jgi:hypothetical protein
MELSAHLSQQRGEVASTHSQRKKRRASDKWKTTPGKKVKMILNFLLYVLHFDTLFFLSFSVFLYNPPASYLT